MKLVESCWVIVRGKRKEESKLVHRLKIDGSNLVLKIYLYLEEY